MKVIQIKDPIKTWWSGDSRVEPYMHELAKVLDEENIVGPTRTNIYNRAYEAVYKAIIDRDKK